MEIPMLFVDAIALGNGLLLILSLIMIPLAYLLGWDHVTLPNGSDFSLISTGFFFVIAAVVTGILSAIFQQTATWLLRFERWTSYAFCGVVTATFLFAIALNYMGWEPTVRVLHTQGAPAFLLIVLAYSWIDATLFTWLKNKRFVRWERRQERTDGAAVSASASAADDAVSGEAREETHLPPRVYRQPHHIYDERPVHFRRGAGGDFERVEDPGAVVIEHVEHFVVRERAQLPSSAASNAGDTTAGADSAH